jgi:SAM-dependent methyltransferase
MKKKERDERLAAHLPTLLQYHQTMLADSVRNGLLVEAIRRHVSSETNFLDVGAGTGVWAILAAQLGAKRVVAIEIEEALIPIIFRHAQENGVADRIEIIHANADDVKIRGKFDVIVSELFGNDALGEQTIKSFVSLRNRFLASGGVLIPQKLSILAVPVRIENSARNIPVNLPIKCEFMKSLKLNYSVNTTLEERRKIKFLAEPQKLIEVDFTNIETPPSLHDLSASWTMNRLREVNAFAVFNCSTFTDDLKMDNFASQSWGTAVYEFQPFTEKSGEIRFGLHMDKQQSIWTVSLPSNAEVKPQNYSQSFALARLKMAQQMTRHRKFNPKKEKRPKAKKMI